VFGLSNTGAGRFERWLMNLGPGAWFLDIARPKNGRHRVPRPRDPVSAPWLYGRKTP